MSDARRVHVVFKTHLDVGFTDTAENVVRSYFDRYIPAALRLAAQTRQDGGDRFVWTTGSWLIHEFLETADATARKQMEAAIEAGDIVWHALPFTTHSELMGAPLFRHGLSLSKRLDDRFGRHTIAGKMTDVPGHTRAIVPLLSDAGVEMLHIGVNAASAVPQVPSPCVWQHTDGSSVILVYAGGYGAEDSIPGLNHVLAFGHTSDNLGPQGAEELTKFYAELHAKYPDAIIEPTGLDGYAHALREVRDTLPVVESEIGDTWIHGVGSDPWRVKRFLALQRWRNRMEKRLGEDHRFRRFSDWLLCIPEHTWGRDTKRWENGEGPEKTYKTDEFLAKRAAGEYRREEETWEEQRRYLTMAVDALEDAPLAGSARTAIEQSDEPSAAGVATAVVGAQLITPSVHLEVSPQGQVTWFEDAEAKRLWADDTMPFARVSYEVFGSDDFDEFMDRYNPDMAATESWARPDFAKVGMEAVLKRGRREFLRTTRVLQGPNLIRIEMVAPEGMDTEFGCPPEVVVNLVAHPARKGLVVEVGWNSKQACRIAEALWLHLDLVMVGEAGFSLIKMGERISPTDIVPDGAEWIHAVEALEYVGERGSITIENLDSSLLSVGGPGLLKFGLPSPGPVEGLAFNLFNNVWGTNFAMWNDGPGSFSFSIKFAEAL